MSGRQWMHGGDLLAQGVDHLLPGRGAASSAVGGCRAVAVVPAVQVRVVEAVLGQPVRRGRPPFLAAAPLRLASFLIGDPAVDEPQLPDVRLPTYSNKRSNRSMHRVDHLTDTQERVLACMRRHIADHGHAPTIQQIGTAVGMRSRTSVHYQLAELEVKCAIVREPGRWRGTRLA
ncbi:hypothetical protein [Streptomyces sp. NPDC059861]|uniref:LexA family protein n=1 Tax=Streptomyces sp. NPDC059861 TaxID=3346974 RepID=UPI00364FD335